MAGCSRRRPWFCSARTTRSCKRIWSRSERRQRPAHDRRIRSRRGPLPRGRQSCRGRTADRRFPQACPIVPCAGVRRAHGRDAAVPGARLEGTSRSSPVAAAIPLTSSTLAEQMSWRMPLGERVERAVLEHEAAGAVLARTVAAGDERALQRGMRRPDHWRPPGAPRSRERSAPECPRGQRLGRRGQELCRQFVSGVRGELPSSSAGGHAVELRSAGPHPARCDPTVDGSGWSAARPRRGDRDGGPRCCAGCERRGGLIAAERGVGRDDSPVEPARRTGSASAASEATSVARE